MVGMELTAQPQGVVGARADARVHRRGRAPEAASRHVRAPSSRPRLEGEAAPGTAKQLEDLWDRHGASVYALACALLGDEAAAARAVTQAMLDLALSPLGESSEDAHRSLVRRVYWRSQEVQVQSSGTPHLPPVMVWLGQLVHLQRACLALCVFGGQTHREAADLLDVPPDTVAELLRAGLREFGLLAAGSTATPA